MLCETNAPEQSEPQRRCICCRSRGQKMALLRFGRLGNSLCFDLRKKLPGRGYYVCAQRVCLEKAFANAFRRVTKLDCKDSLSDVETFVTEVLLPGLRKRYEECLLAGKRNGKLLIGADCVEEAAKNDALSCYILATDASESTQQKYRSNALRKALPCLGLLDRSHYGRLFGASDRVVLGWLPGALCQEFIELESIIVRLGSHI